MIPITFDMDSVLVDNTHPLLMQWLRNKYGEDRVHDCIDGHGNMVFNIQIEGVSNNQLHKDFAEGLQDITDLQRTSPWSRPVLDYVYKVTGCRIHILTARHKSTMPWTTRWLYKVYPGIEFIVHMPGAGKLEFCRKHSVGIHVDDRYKTVCDLVEDSLTFPLMYNRKWNTGREMYVDNRPCYTRINDLRGVIPMLNVLIHRNQFDWPIGVPHPINNVLKTEV